MAGTVRQILEQKGQNVWSISSAETVAAAIKLMADKDIGSLAVLEDGNLVGIITERHYARNVFLKGRASPQTLVGDIMEREVVCVQLNQSVEECMAIMSERRVRHLPGDP